MTDFIALTRDAKAFPESHDAIVEAADLAKWQAEGWSVEGDGAMKATAKATGKAKAAAAPEALTAAEIHADLEGMGVDFDPRAELSDLLALRDEARAIRDA